MKTGWSSVSVSPLTFTIVVAAITADFSESVSWPGVVAIVVVPVMAVVASAELAITVVVEAAITITHGGHPFVATRRVK